MNRSIIDMCQNMSRSTMMLAERKSTKRALFTSPIKSPLSTNRKRKRSEESSEDSLMKLHRSFSLEVRSNASNVSFSRALSESSFNRPAAKSDELSDLHKKKLQWAVYKALQMKDVKPTHAQFKVYASVLARVTRKLLPGLKSELRTTEKMFRIAQLHSHAVVQGKSVDEIVGAYLKEPRVKRPQGYVGLEEFNRSTAAECLGERSKKDDSFKDGVGCNKENVLQDKANIMESIEKRREFAGYKSKLINDSRIDRIRKVISFDDEF